jgi:hypothetical protein
MGILDWLLGSRKKASSAPEPSLNPLSWERSERGNLTALHRGNRATIFQQDGAWKYVFADEADQDEPYFSEAFPSEAAAKREAEQEFGF